jgi:hypothetical protein
MKKLLLITITITAISLLATAAYADWVKSYESSAQGVEWAVDIERVRTKDKEELRATEGVVKADATAVGVENFTTAVVNTERASLDTSVVDTPPADEPPPDDPPEETFVVADDPALSKSDPAEDTTPVIPGRGDDRVGIAATSGM